ncbi:hypothetical protein [Lachnoclostridium sp. Marseille-P6806]|uniref:hypothetical protein n=1 Tax=Lachnoclostridium sp. Marseille-P6806 TaxID=2364793 RepID=UPI00102F9A11|nr:hypothetical protein [Lachnoclostridium sp. Marseille-P6806]
MITKIISEVVRDGVRYAFKDRKAHELIQNHADEIAATKKQTEDEIARAKKEERELYLQANAHGYRLDSVEHLLQEQIETGVAAEYIRKIEQEQLRAKTAERANADDISALRVQHTADVESLGGTLDMHTTAIADNTLLIAANKDSIATNASDISGLKTAVETLNGSGTGSVSKTVHDSIAAVVADAPENLDTLREISDWISGHEESASAMNSAIHRNTDAIAAEVSRAQAAEASAMEAVTAETSRAQAAEAENHAKINAEVVRAQAAEPPFRFGVDSEGNYGYIKAGADAVTPFKGQADIDAAYQAGRDAVGTSVVLKAMGTYSNNSGHDETVFVAVGGYNGYSNGSGYIGISTTGTVIDQSSFMGSGGWSYNQDADSYAFVQTEGGFLSKLIKLQDGQQVTVTRNGWGGGAVFAAKVSYD